MRIFLTALMLALSFATASMAGVAGKVSFQPKRGQAPLPAETLIWLQPIKAERIPRVTPKALEIVTRNKALEPHVLIVPVGSTVRFPNEDFVTHNIFSVSPSNKFDLGLYRHGTSKSRQFTNAGIVNVYCNVHPQMSAVLQVVDSPYYTQADEKGEFSIADVVPGTYRLVAWNETGGSARADIEVDGSGKVKGSTSLLLDSRSDRTTNHLNKYGQPYSTGKDY